LWIRDAASLQWEYLSPAFDRLYGVTREDALRGDNFASWLALIAPDDRDPMLAHIERVRAGEVSTVEFRVPRPTDGQVRRFRANAFPMRGTDGVVRQIGGIEADVTEERLAAERLELMVTELQHRTRNLIAVVQSIASQTFKNSDSLDAFRQSFSERLAALSRVQGLLSRSNLEPITMDALVKLELAALNDGKVSIAGPRVTLDKAIVQTLALALHELATNARKHGALSTPEGRIAVTWDTTSHPDGQQALCLRWLETGIGPTSGRDSGSGTGYGRTLIERALAYTLGARTTFNLSEDGLRCIIELPLKAQAP
jgi:PAS domain S-box-containing protein